MLNPQFLMNALLYYDRLAYDYLDYNLTTNVHQQVPSPVADKLIHHSGLIFDYGSEEFILEHNKHLEDILNNRIHAFDPAYVSGKLSETKLDWSTFRQLTIREHATVLNNYSHDHFSQFVVNDYVNYRIKSGTSENLVVNVILNQFPEISSEVDFNKFLEFKADPSSMLKLRRLRDWATDIAKKSYTEKELFQKLEYLLQEYRQQMEIHKLRYTLTKSQSIIVSTLEFIEGLFIKFSRPTKALFELEINRLNLLDAEQKAIGKELAYIYKAKEAFGNK